MLKILEILLIIPYIFILIGNLTLYIFKKSYILIKQSYKYFLRIFVKSLRLFITKTKQLPNLYLSSIKNAIKIILKSFWITKKIKNVYDILRIIIINTWQGFKKITLIYQNPTTSRKQKVKNYKNKYKVLYPTPINIAHNIRSFFAGVTITLVLVTMPIYFFSWLKNLPDPALLDKRDIDIASKIMDREGNLLYEIYRDENRTPLKFSQIPELVKNATIAIEDKSFYTHPGFSIEGIIRSLKEIIIHKRIQGGSTITQQLIKSALLSPEVTINRKVKEILLAFWAEQIYSKNQILEMYLNQVPYGGTAWGIESASKIYFGKSIHEANLGEIALLAGLPAAPSKYSPFGNNPELAFLRQREVLKRMVEEKYISQEDARKAQLEKIDFISPDTGIRAPHFVMYVKDILEREYGQRLVERGGLRIKTTLDLKIQEEVQFIVSQAISQLKNLKVGNGAVLITNPKNGEILAMVGSENYFSHNNDGNVNLTTSLRQPGSSIKVVNYVAALENGYTAATIINDSPVSYKSPGSPTYTPVNYDGRFHGPVTLRYALGNSYNIPAVKTLAKIGVRTMIETGKKMGIDTWNDEGRFGLALTLGGGEVTMIDMGEVYGTLANLGNRVDLSPIIEVSDYKGKILYHHNIKPIRAVTEEAAFIIGDILSDNLARTNAFGANSSLVIPGKTVSVKTGTTNDKRDNWTIGYTPSYVVVVWVGNNDNSPMDPKLTSGITGAAPIWHEVFSLLLENKEDMINPVPSNIISIPCNYNRNEYFIKGTEPSGGKCVPLPSYSPTTSPQT